MPRPKKKPFNRLPNGFGSIKKLSGNRRNPYAVYAPSRTINGVRVPGELIECVETWEAGYERLVLYKANKEWELKKKKEKLYTFEEVFKMFYQEKFELSQKKLSESSSMAINAAYKNCAALHNKIFTEIEYQDLQDTIDGKIGVLKRPSLMQIKTLYNGIYKYAMKRNICEKDYSRYVEIRAKDDVEHGIPFSINDLKIMLDHPSFVTDSLLIMCLSGWRITEFLKMKINKEDLLFEGGIKTNAGKNRIVPIHPLLIPILDRNNWEVRKMTTANFRHLMYSELEALGIEKHTPHDCRHTFSWLCDKCNVDRLSKKMLLGHAIANDVTDAFYGHRTVDELRQEINKIVCN